MQFWFARAFAFAGVLSATLTLVPSVSGAQSAADFVAGGGATAGSASNMLRDELLSRKAERAASARRQSQNMTAQAGAPTGATPAPFSSLETPKPGFQHPNSPGVSYTVDLNSTFAAGDTGYKQNNLAGGIDASAYFAPEKYTRIFAGYYQLQEYPIGFDQGIVPTYVQNGAAGFGRTGRTSCQAFGAPGVAPVNLAGIVPNCPANLNTLQNDAAVKNQIFVLSLQKIVYIGGLIPIVISPTYIARKGEIGGTDDLFLAYNPSTDTYKTVHLRSAETKGVLFSLPLASSPKLFAVFTIGPQWLVNTNGNNRTNHAQIFQSLDLRYFANPETTIFVEPSRLQDYLPNDPYPQDIPTLIAGLNHKLGGPHSPLFVQGFIAEGTVQNPVYGHTGRVGVIDATCVNSYPACISNPDPRTNTAITFGGFRASQFVLSVGLGTPSVIPL
jgi:hypothetical protein